MYLSPIGLFLWRTLINTFVFSDLCEQAEIGHGGSIYPREMCSCYKLGLLFFTSWAASC